MKKVILLFGIIILLSDIALCESIRATAEDGKTVILHPDGTWENQDVPVKAQSQFIIPSYSKPTSAQKLVQGKRKNYGIWIDESKWIKTVGVNPNHDITLQHIDGDVFAITVSERVVIPLESMREIIVRNAKTGGAEDIKIILEERKIVNGTEILHFKMNGKFLSIHATVMYYVYSGHEGTIQIMAYAGKNLFDEYKNDITALLNGFEVFQERKPPPQQTPPPVLALTADMAQADLVKAGEAIFYGKGTCALCHPIGEKGERAPNLEGIGARAETRIKEAVYKGNATNGTEYLVESLHNPAVYVVEGYQPSMPPLGRQLNDLEIAALVAFQQSLGGDVAVDGHTRFPTYRGEGTDGISAVTSVSGKSGAELVKAWKCNNCHTFDSPVRILGPSLWDIGARANAAYIRESILQPDAKVVPGYPRGVEKATLEALGFYQTVTLQELDTLVDYLVSLKGGK